MGSPQVITKVYDLLLYLLPLVAKFPRSERYLLGERLESAAFDILELLLAATYSREKQELLHRANLWLEQTRYYVRLSKDLKRINLHQYEVVSKMLLEIGLQVGGWIKHERS